MRSAVFHGKGDVRVEDVIEPQIPDGSVLVDVEWCGLCGSDLHLYQLGLEPFGELTMSGRALPYALGHEFCGRVLSSPQTSGFKHGDHVFVDPRLPCEQCLVCQDGKDYCCPSQGGIGYSRSGGLSERVAVPARNLCLLPSAIPLQNAALIEPIAVAVHAVRATAITDFRNQQILVLGAGPVGLAVILVLRAYHPKKILVSEPTPTRRAQVLELAHVTFDPGLDSVVQGSKEITEGRGVDIVFDCAGTLAGLSDGLDALKCEGLYMNLAMYEKPMTLPVLPALMKHVTIKFAAVYGRGDIEETIRLIVQGQLHGYENMVTRRISIDNVVDQGFRRLLQNKDDDIKVLVTPKSPGAHDKEVGCIEL